MNKVLNVLLHIDDYDNWENVCNNAEELLKMSEVGNYAMNLEIVVNGEAVKNLANGNINVLTLKDCLRKLHDKGVFIYCCSKSLQENNVDPSVIFSFVEIVPSGIFHIVLRETNNFTYIKP